MPTCADCKKWVHDQEWRLSKRGGQPVSRPSGMPTPCFRCPKSKDGRPNPSAEMSGKNARAFQAYLEIKAGATMPDDPITRRNCALIRWLEDTHQSAQLNLGPLLAGMLGAAVGTTPRKKR